MEGVYSAGWECMEHLHDLVMVVGADFRVKYLNRAAKRFYGVQGEVAGLVCHQISHGLDRPCHEAGKPCPVRKTMKEGKSIRMVHRHSGGDGFEILQEVTTAPICNHQGEVQGVLKITREINNAELLERIGASEQRYKNILASSPNAVITVDKKGIVVDCNQAVEEIFGLPASGLLGRHVTMLIPERFRSGHLKSIRRAVSERFHRYAGKTVDMVGWRVDRQEEMPITLSLVTWQEGGEPFFTAIIMDNSRQKALETSLAREKNQLERAQADLAQQHRELKNLFSQVERAKQEWERTMDCIADLVMLVDEQDRIIRCNRAVVDFTASSYAELMNRNWEELLFDGGMETHHSRDGAIELFHRPNGRWYLLNIYSYQVKTEAEVRYVITLHDTTTLRRVTRELERTSVEIENNRRKLKAALDEISSLIVKVTSGGGGQVRFEHPGLKRCWEVKSCMQTECPCHGQEPQRCWQKVGTLSFGEAQHEFAAKLASCTSCSFYQEATVDPIFLIGEQFNNMMHMLEKKNRELEDAYQELKQTQAKILQQEKMASIGQLAAGVAHELNNPLGFIASNLATLQKYMARLTQFVELQARAVPIDDQTMTRELADRRRELRIDHILADTGSLIAESLEGAERLKKIIQDLKSFSRVDQAQLTHADITECLESTINIAWNELKYHTTVHREYGELPLTRCYPQQLNQVFMNLLINAAHAISPGKGDITIRTWCDDGSIFVAITDTGCGIPDPNLKKLFDPFFTTKEVGKGTGLGLSIAFDIVKRHQGDITVSSEVGKGSTFRVRIPLVEPR